jgi:hypothetical protein
MKHNDKIDYNKNKEPNYKDVKKAFDIYLEKLNETVNFAKLASFHTKNAASNAEKAANYAMLAVFRIQEFLKKLPKR